MSIKVRIKVRCISKAAVTKGPAGSDPIMCVPYLIYSYYTCHMSLRLMLPRTLCKDVSWRLPMKHAREPARLDIYQVDRDMQEALKYLK